jgi:hypothetical protein
MMLLCHITVMGGESCGRCSIHASYSGHDLKIWISIVAPSGELKSLVNTGFSVSYCACSGRLPNPNELLQKDDMVKIKRCIYALQRDGLPPITTHNVEDDWNDPVLTSVRRCQLFNTIHDRVKVRS